MSSELENSGIRVAVGDCSVTERRRWRPPYQTAKTVHVHAKHYKHNEDGRTAPGVCGNGSVPLSHSGNVVTRIKNWMILIITINLSTRIISINSVRFALSAYLRNAKPILNLRRLSRLISLPRKKCKTNSGSGSASNARVFQPQWLKQFNCRKYGAETKLSFCRTSVHQFRSVR